MSPEQAGATVAGAVLGIDHVALPVQNTGAMITFYRSLGLSVVERPYLVRVHLREQMINFHRPEVGSGTSRFVRPQPYPHAATFASSGGDRRNRCERCFTGLVPTLWRVP